jgi:glutaredoxin-like protein
MEKLLNDQVSQQIKDAFAELKEPVQIVFFASRQNCDYCAETQQILEEVTALSDKLALEIYDVHEDREAAGSFQVEEAPAIVIAAKDGSEVTNLGIQFLGIPSGHEFSTLISDIVMVSKRESGLSEETREFLRNLEQPLRLQVFVTPTCPYCPRAVVLAHQMAMENPRMIRAEGVEATEFPVLVHRFNVHGVPQTVINAGAGIVVGAVPEQNLLAEITRALQN